MESSRGYDETPDARQERRTARKQKETLHQAFYHASPRRFKIGDILVPGEGDSEVSLADSPIPHGTILERINPAPEYRKARIEKGSWNSDWDATWHVYRVVPTAPVRYMGEEREARTTAARIEAYVGNAMGILQGHPDGSYVRRFDKVRGAKTSGRGPGSYWEQQATRYLRQSAEYIRQAYSEGNAEHVRWGLEGITRDEKFDGPGGLKMRVTYPIKSQSDLMEKSVEQKKVMGLLVSGKNTRIMTGDSDHIPLSDVISLIRQTYKGHEHLSFSMTVWDETQNPIDMETDKEFLSVLNKEYPGIDFSVIFGKREWNDYLHKFVVYSKALHLK